MNNKSHKIFLIFMNLLRNLISSHHLIATCCSIWWCGGACIESGKNKNAFTHSVIYLLRYLTCTVKAYGISSWMMSRISRSRFSHFCHPPVKLETASDALKRRDMSLCDNKSNNMSSLLRSYPAWWWSYYCWRSFCLQKDSDELRKKITKFID